MSRYNCKHKIATLSIGLILLLTAGSCIRDREGVDPSTLSNQAALVITEQGGNQGDVSNVLLYIFDENKQFIDTLSTTLDTPINLLKLYGCHASITVMAYGNTKGGNLTFPSLKQGDPIQNLLVKLNSSGTLANSPDDLFMGSSTIDLSIDDGKAKTYYEEISRRISSMTIVARNLQQHFGTTDTDFYFVVRDTYDTFDAQGQLTGSLVQYKPKVAYVPNTDFFANIFKTYPSAGKTVTVDIYKGSNLVYSTDIDAAGNPFQLLPNTTLNVIIEFTSGGAINTTMAIEPWYVSDIHEIFN